MIQLIKNKDYYGLAIFTLLVILVGYQEIISPAIGVFILVHFAAVIFVRTFTFKINRLTGLFIILFLFYMVGILWSQHQSIGWKLLEYKMSFFIFPILFFWKKNDTNLWLVLEGLVWGAIFLALRFVWAFSIAAENDLSSFEVSRQILDLHPTYSSLYLTLAGVFLTVGFFSKKINWPLYVIIPLNVLFLFLILSMQSFAAILFIALLLAIALGYFVFKYTKRVGLITYILICPFIGFYSITKIDALNYDVEMAMAVVNEVSEGKVAFLEKNKSEISGTKERMMLWFISTEIIGENPFGVGTGDIDFYLDSKCDKYNLLLLKEQGLNPHNQFLQIAIDIGVLAMIYLLFMIGIVMYLGIKEKNYFLFFVALSLFFNALFESILQRQSGIVFYSIIICLILVYRNQIESKPENFSG